MVEKMLQCREVVRELPWVDEDIGDSKKTFID